MKRIKVIHVVNRFDTGGMENGINNISNLIDRSRFEPVVCCRRGLGRMIARLKDDVHTVDMVFPEGKSFSLAYDMARYFTKEKPDVVHAHGWGGGSFDAVVGARLAHVPVVINGEHGMFFTKPHQIMLQRFLARLCDATLSVSQSLKEEIIGKLGISGTRITVIRNGVDTARFTGTHDTTAFKAELYERHGLAVTPDMFIIGCVGSVKPSKNQMALIRALEYITEQNPAHRTVALIVGDGVDRQKLQSYVAASPVADKVFFLGERSDIPTVLSLINVLSLTSLAGQEGLPNVILEAMSSGVPVVSTRSVGPSEIIEDGMNGYLTEQDDIAGLAGSFMRLAADRSASSAMGGRARAFIEAKYSIQSMVSAYEQIYLKLLTEKGALR